MTDPQHARSGQITANLLCLTSMVAWSAGLPASQYLVGHIPPLALSAMRLGLAGILLLLLWILIEGRGPLRRANWLRGMVVGTVCMGFGSFFVILALKLTDPVTVAIITAIMPVIGIGLEVLLDGRRMTALLIAGLGLSVVGGIIALDPGRATPDLGLGALCALMSTCAYTWGSRATVNQFPDLTALGRTAITVAGAGIVTFAVTLVQGALQGHGVDWGLLTLQDLGALGLSAVGAIVVAQTLWILSVARLGVGIAALHSNATPFYVMVIALALGGSWNGMQALGAAIVVLGVLVAQSAPFWQQRSQG
jgi:drug/metabolite transporter (DMT)-like permease